LFDKKIERMLSRDRSVPGKIAAIKAYRNRTAASLKDAKDHIDAISSRVAAQHGVQPTA